MFDVRVTTSSVHLLGDGIAMLEARSPHQPRIVSVAGGPALFTSGITLRGGTGAAGLDLNLRKLPPLRS